MIKQIKNREDTEKKSIPRQKESIFFEIVYNAQKKGFLTLLENPNQSQ